MKSNRWLCTYIGILGAALSALGSVRGVTLLDPTFNGDGRVVTGTGPNTNNLGHALTIQPDGKLLVAGASSVDGAYRFGLIRYEPDGSLDSTFGGGAFVSTLLLEIGKPVATCIAVQPDGRIVVAGNGVDLAMVRYMPDGSLDTSFNGTGKLLGNVRGKFGTFYTSGVAIQVDGKIVVCGTNYYSPSPGAGNRGHMTCLRFNANGTVDTTFNGTGKVELAPREHSYANGMVLQADGKIVLAGHSADLTVPRETDATLLRLLPDGSLDTTFNGTGIAIHRLEGRNSHATCVTLQPDGKFLIGGGVAVDGAATEMGEFFNMMSARYGSDGSLDTSFNLAGFSEVDFGAASRGDVSSVMLQGDKIVIVGTRHDPAGKGHNFADFAMARFAADGALDPSFNVGGQALTDFNCGQDRAYGGAVQADGKIVAAGFSVFGTTNPTGVDIVLARYNLDGASSPGEDNGGGLLLKGPPTVNRSPLSQLVPLGGVLNLYCSHGGTPPFTYEWSKNGKAIPGATGRSYSIPMDFSAADIGKYTVRIANAKGSAVSRAAFVGGIDTEPLNLDVEENWSTTLKPRVFLPPGSRVTYQWHYNGDPMSNSSTVKGVTTAGLKLTKPKFGDEGDYSCLVSMGSSDGSQFNYSPTSVTIVPAAIKPVMNPVTLANATVNDLINQTITATNNPKSFDAKGLPPGIVLNKTTGVLSGKPIKAKLVRGEAVPYKVTFTASNNGGKSDPLVVDWLILPVPQELTGTFQGLVARNTALNGSADATEGLGGSIRVSVTPQGSLTGVLTLGKQTLRFTAPLGTSASGAGNAVATIKRGGKQSELTVALALTASGDLSGLVTDGVDAAELTGWRQTAGAVDAGRYPQALISGTTASAGSASVTVTRTGIANWSGKLADGATFTGSGSSGPHGEVALHRLLYGQTGSVQGWVEIESETEESANGELSWLKRTPATTAAASQSSQTLTVVGVK